ncbi:nuclear receptor subfamily 1 group I member 3-like [Gastrophryne carolinensis]
MSEDDSSSSFDFIGMSVLDLKSSKKTKNDEKEKICAVCGDKAIGYNFHVLTCEGCKGFFRRSINKGLIFNCSFNGSCTVAKATRQHCQACRLQKCLKVGMRKDMVLSKEVLLAQRELRKRKKQECLRRGMRVTADGSLTEEQKQLISILLEARKHFDIEFKPFVGCRFMPQVSCGRSPVTSPVDGLDSFSLSFEEYMEDSIMADNLEILPQFSDIITYAIQQAINFAKEIPAFRALPIDDQISLLKGAVSEVATIHYNSAFNLRTNQWDCGNVTLNIENGALTVYQRMFLEPLLKFHITLRKLNLDDAEYGLIQALALFSPDRPGVIGHGIIDEIQEKVALTLKCYIDYHRALPDSRFLYGKLLSLMAEVRSLNEGNAKQMVHIQTHMSEAMSPLMKEIFI